MSRRERQPARPSRLPLRHFRILVVEDDEDIREFIRSALRAAGASVIVAQSVEAAIKAYRKHPPHVLVTDIRLDNSDGYTLIQAIRELNLEYRGFTPAIAITGFSSPEDEQRALNSGFDEYLVKPLNPEEIVSAVVRVWRKSGDLAA